MDTDWVLFSTVNGDYSVRFRGRRVGRIQNWDREILVYFEENDEQETLIHRITLRRRGKVAENEKQRAIFSLKKTLAERKNAQEIVFIEKPLPVNKPQLK